jgi:hypothetical protein
LPNSDEHGGAFVVMSRIIPLVLLAAVVTVAQAEEPGASPAEQSATPEHGPPPTSIVSESLTGTVIETANATGYTYVHFDTGEQKVWAAAPEFAVEVGETVTISGPMPMHNHYSRTLDRTFELVYFVARVEVEGAEGRPAEPPSGKPSWMQGGRGAAAKPVEVDLSGIEKAAEGKTVAELYAGKADLAGKEIVVRGRVVKSTSGIMGKNWLHVRDGTGAPGSDDLTVTTDATVETGSKVLVRGRLTADRDFGAGYKYEIIVENAEITVE